MIIIVANIWLFLIQQDNSFRCQFDIIMLQPGSVSFD